MPIRRSETPKVIIKTPGTAPPPSPALMNKIASAEKAQKPEGAAGAEGVKEVALDPAAKQKAADDVAPKKFEKQGIRGPNFQPIGMDPRQAQALGVIALGDDGLDKLEAEQHLDDIWFSLDEKQRVAAGRAERFRVELEQKLLRLAKNRQPAHVIKGQLNARLIERGKTNAKLEFSRYEHLLAEDSAALLARFIEETSHYIDAAYRMDLIRGAPAEDLGEVQQDLVRKLIYQEMQSRLRRMGDRGIRHIMGSIDIQERIFGALAGVVEINPRDYFVGRIAQVHHDLGYTCHASQVSYQAGRMHRHYSARIFNDELNRYRKVMAPKDQQRVRDGVVLHAHLDFEPVEDWFGSAIRLADHLMPFQQHWLYPRLLEIPGGEEAAKAFFVAVKTGDREQMAPPLKALWDLVNRWPNMSMNMKEDLLSGVRAFDRGAFVVEMGKLAGTFSGARYEPRDKILEIGIVPSPERLKLQHVFDCGQDQLWFFLRKRGNDEEMIRSGNTLEVRCREQGPVALKLFSGALPEKKLSFKGKRPGGKIRGSL
ncbi:MAG: hypothetical protein IT381_14400 [Deltaproteobacteria bacterium]|nr:hypothetical protein [Deltaproteobacteria bacterium]